jgi:hypothetical protein
MKKRLLLLSCLILFQILPAQVVFCPPGAEWSYTFLAGHSNQIVSNEKITYSRDSMLNGVSVKVLLHNFSFSMSDAYRPGPTLIKQNGDTIFMRNAITQHSWQILYNFNVTAGQHWENQLLTAKNTGTSITGFTVTVDSVKTITVNNLPMRELYVKYATNGQNGNIIPGIYSSSVIRERFGNNRFMFNFINTYSSDPDYVVSFLCYTDSTFGTTQFTSKPCDYSNLMSVFEFNSEILNLTLYPNPVSDQLIIKSGSAGSANAYTFDLINVLGKVVVTRQTLSGNDQVYLGHLEDGVYFIQVFEKGKRIAIRKILKH